MISNFMLDFFKAFYSSFSKTSEEQSFKKSSFWVRKKIFATYDFTSQLACLKPSEKDQELITLFDSRRIFPIPNMWEKPGGALAKIEDMEEEVIKDLLCAAYNHVAPEKLKFHPNSPTLTRLKL